MVNIGQNWPTEFRPGGGGGALGEPPPPYIQSIGCAPTGLREACGGATNPHERDGDANGDGGRLHSPGMAESEQLLPFCKSTATLSTPVPSMRIIANTGPHHHSKEWVPCKPTGVWTIRGTNAAEQAVQLRFCVVLLCVGVSCKL